MPATHHIDPEARLGILRLTGHVSGPQLVRDIRAFMERGEWAHGFRVLYDAREVTSLDVSPDDVPGLRSLIDEFRPRIGRGRSALVGWTEDVLTIGHLLKALAPRGTGREVEVFEDLQDTLAWLGVEEAPGFLAEALEE